MPALRTLLKAAAFGAVCAATLTAGDPVPRATLPDPVAEAVRGVFPRGPITAVVYDDLPDGREYETQLKVDGRDAYVVATADGVVIETGQAIDEQAVPAEVRATMGREAPEGGVVTECFRREFHRNADGEPLETPSVLFEITFGAGRDERFLAVNADGSLRSPEPRTGEGE